MARGAKRIEEYFAAYDAWSGTAAALADGAGVSLEAARAWCAKHCAPMGVQLSGTRGRPPLIWSYRRPASCDGVA
jgi:hypothetical protein